jgi:succinate-semialdehyde dehydrogenase / glutarate-semialdehyde dehydrogenase
LRQRDEDITATITTVNPATGQALHRYSTMETSEVFAALHSTATAQRDWAAASFDRRGETLRNAAAELRRRCDSLALLITREMGKPIRESIAEVEKCAGVLEYYADNGASFLADEYCGTDADESWVSYEPIGVVLAIMPWNFPLWQVFRFAAPALMAGNAIMLKHSPNTTGCALEAERVFAAAGLAPGLFKSVVIAETDVPAITKRLIADPKVGAVTLTGSEQAGIAIGTAAGREIKKCVLELGGSDPFIVLADADLPRVAAQAVKGRFLNAGQSCISPKRFIVEQPVAEEFSRLLVEAVEQLKIGDPEDPTTEVGPLARADLRDTVSDQVQSSVDSGAQLLSGGAMVTDRPGNFYLPTVLGKVAPGMCAYDEEIFGPVAAVISVGDVEHAIGVANDTRFGLGASVWTTDVAKGMAVGRQITAGACFINSLVASDPRVPFGGTKRSGFGRELSKAGILEFVNVRTWWVVNDCRGEAFA